MLDAGGQHSHAVLRPASFLRTGLSCYAALCFMQEDSSPEDKALKDRIARGDDILCQLYAEKPDHSQAMHGSHDTAQDATDK